MAEYISLNVLIKGCVLTNLSHTRNRCVTAGPCSASHKANSQVIKSPSLEVSQSAIYLHCAALLWRTDKVSEEREEFNNSLN